MSENFLCVISGTGNGGQVVQNTLCVRRDNAVSASDDASALATRIESAWRTTGPLAVLSSSYTFVSVKVTKEGDDTLQAIVAGSGSGTVTGEALPMFVTAKVKWVTGRSGWAARGRWSLGPISESQVTNDQLQSPWPTSIQNAMTAFRAAVDGTSRQWQCVVRSTIDNGVPRPVPLTASITGNSVPLIVGSQLSRKRRT